jgi:hypothetical protein
VVAVSGDTVVIGAYIDDNEQGSAFIRNISQDTATVTVTVNAAPTVNVPAAQTADEDVDKAISGISVGDPGGDALTVTLQVSHGSQTLGSTAGLIISGNGSALVSLSGSLFNLNTALAGLVYRGVLNYSGADMLNVTASDGSLSSSGSVAITVKSAAQQAADLQAQINAMRDAGVLNQVRPTP